MCPKVEGKGGAGCIAGRKIVKPARPKRLLLTGGGTGGHLFPALAAAEEFCRRHTGAKVLFLGTRRKMDRTSLAQSGYDVKTIFCYGLKGKSVFEVIKAVTVLPLSFVQALLVIVRFRPNVVLGVGGYVTGPVIAAAKVLGKKTVIHEQNSIPGLANRKLGHLADRVCISLPQSAAYFPAGKTVLTGNPVRKNLLGLAAEGRASAAEGPKTLLVLGGSQGAHGINQRVVQALCEIGVSVPLEIIHQTGAADEEMVRSAYEKHGIEADVAAFFQDMASVYGKADLLVSRAGATTLAELAVLGKPAILIPFPFAADDHQQRNADYYVEGGGCVKLAEHEAGAERLAAAVEELLKDPARCQAMSRAMRKLAMPEAAAKIVDVCLDAGYGMKNGEKKEY